MRFLKNSLKEKDKKESVEKNMETYRQYIVTDMVDHEIERFDSKSEAEQSLLDLEAYLEPAGVFPAGSLETVEGFLIYMVVVYETYLPHNVCAFTSKSAAEDYIRKRCDPEKGWRRYYQIEKLILDEKIVAGDL